MSGSDNTSLRPDGQKLHRTCDPPQIRLDPEAYGWLRSPKRAQRRSSDGLPHRFGPSVIITSEARSRLRVLVLADIRLCREGLAHVLDKSGAMDVVAVCSRLDEALAAIEREQVDIALVGLSTGRTLVAGAALVRAHPDTRVVALAIDSTDDVVAVAEAGVSGYVPKEASVGELVRTIQSVARGEMPCSPQVAAGLCRRLAELAPKQRPGPSRPPLTLRERQVLALVGEDLSNKEIAQRLCIEVTTVKNHVHNMLEKLQVHRRRDAVALVRSEAGEEALVPHSRR
jgi:two-component system nitrate/nitrite response regulator NarL